MEGGGEVKTAKTLKFEKGGGGVHDINFETCVYTQQV